MPRARRRPGQLGDDQRAMRHVGIVAGILDDAGAGACRSPARRAPARKLGVWPRGRRIVTGSGKRPVSSAANAARAAAAAQAPVVQPRRSGAVCSPCHAAILEQLAAEFHRYCQGDRLICRIP